MFRVVLGAYLDMSEKKKNRRWGRVRNEYLIMLYLPYSRYYWGYKISMLLGSTYPTADAIYLFSLALQPSAGYGLLVHEIS
jgi:hypothetical protein